MMLKVICAVRNEIGASISFSKFTGNLLKKISMAAPHRLIRNQNMYFPITMTFLFISEFDHFVSSISVKFVTE